VTLRQTSKVNSLALETDRVDPGLNGSELQGAEVVRHSSDLTGFRLATRWSECSLHVQRIRAYKHRRGRINPFWAWPSKSDNLFPGHDIGEVITLFLVTWSWVKWSYPPLRGHKLGEVVTRYEQREVITIFKGKWSPCFNGHMLQLHLTVLLLLST